MARAIFLFMVLPMAAATPAAAQSGGIQVAPVMVALSSEHSIASLRMRNGRTRPTAFEIDVYAWSQVNGGDVLQPSRDIIVAPGVFEIPAGAEQVVRLGVQTADGGGVERAYRLILRELPPPRGEGARLSFALEMSLPVFVAPTYARPSLQAHVEARGANAALVLANPGGSHIQIASVQDMDATDALNAPRYLLAGARVDIPLRSDTRAVRLRAAEPTGAQTERIIHVDRQTMHAALR